MRPGQRYLRRFERVSRRVANCVAIVSSMAQKIILPKEMRGKENRSIRGDTMC